jgi:hypothetical protein
MIESSKSTKSRNRTAPVGVGGLLSDIYMEILADLGLCQEDWAYLRTRIMAYARKTLERQRPAGSQVGLSRADVSYVYNNIFRELIKHKNMSMGKYLTGLMVLGIRKVEWTQKFTHQDGRVTEHTYSFGVGETDGEAVSNSEFQPSPSMISMEEAIELAEKYRDASQPPLSTEIDSTGVF